ncbi:hypothetical protein ALQ81_102404, partial [Pseudomonas syringae pv. pisi]
MTPPSSLNGPDAFMDIHSLWLKTQEIWDMLDQHPWVRTGLAPDVRVVPQLARHAAIRRTAHQA